MDSFNTALNCGTFLLPWNAIMLALGILVSVVVTEILVKKRGMYKDLALDACIVGIPCGIIGGRLFAALSGKIAFASIFDLTASGMNLPGALLFATIGILIYLSIKKLNIGEALDVMMPGALFGLAVGRWSDFFLCDGLGKIAGEGVPKFFPLVTFTSAYFADHETVAYAVFFLDVLMCLVLGIVSLILLKKKMSAGRAAGITSIIYLFAEFIMEWLRDGESRQIVFGEIRFNQLVLIGMLLAAVAAAVLSKKQKQTAEAAGEQPTVTEETEQPIEPEEPTEEPKQDEPEKETQPEA